MSAWAAAVCRAPSDAVGLGFSISFLQKLCWFHRKPAHCLRSSIIVYLAASAPATTRILSFMLVVNIIRSDDLPGLLYPDYGRPAIEAGRPILFPSIRYNPVYSLLVERQMRQEAASYLQ